MITSIFDILQSSVGMLNAWIAQALHGNTIVAGAVTASIIGSLFYVLRKSPQRIWARIRRYIIFTYVIEYKIEQYGSSMIQDIASKFEYELQNRVSKRRASARLITRKNRIVETLSDGGFFFRYSGAWIYASRTQEKADPGKGSSVPAEPRITLSLTSLRFNRSKIIRVLSESAREYMVPGIYQIITSSYSGNPTATRVRNFTSIPVMAIDTEVKKRLDDAIDNFVLNRAANNASDRPQKLTIMLHGEPGTGKSSLSEYVAFRLKTSLFCVNAQTSDSGRPANLSNIVAAVRENISDDEIPVILADDFDTFWNGLRRRVPKRSVGENSPEPMHAPPEDNAPLGRLLVSLQSPTEINDCVVIFTTNHLEKVDPAMYRPGRITLLLEIGRMTPRSIAEYFEKSYNQQWPAHLPIERALRGCDVSAFYAANSTDPQGFITAVTSTTISADELFNIKELTPN